MKRSLSTAAKLAAGISVAGVMVAAATAVAFPLQPRDCLPGVYCLDVYDPVTCSNGVTYSNSCYAAKACATDCVPGFPEW